MGYYMSALVAGGLTGRIGWRSSPMSSAGAGRSAGSRSCRSRAASSSIGRCRIFRGRRAREAPAFGGRCRTQASCGRPPSGARSSFVFVGTFSYVTYRLERPPFGYGTVAGSAVFGLWILGFTTPVVGRIVDRVGWRRVAGGSAALCAVGLLITLPSQIVGVVLGLAAVALGNFAGVMAAQIGVSDASVVDRGAASAVFFSFYYASGALGGYLPGLAWQAWRWNGVAPHRFWRAPTAGLALVRPRHDQG